VHPGLLLSAVVTGIATGAVYAMVGVGYTIVYNATDVFNLAQGDLVMVGVMLSYLQLDVLHWPMAVTGVVDVVAVGVLALFEERTVVRPLLRLGQGQISWLISTLAFSIILETVAANLYGDHAPLAIPSPLRNEALHAGPVVLSTQYLLVVAALMLVVGAVEMLYARTWTGKAMRAAAADREAASLVGVDPGRIGAIAFAVAGAVAGLAGFVMAPIVFANTSIGLNYSLYGFLALAIGGFGSMSGAVVGALAVGVAQSVWDLYLGSQIDIVAGLGLLLVVMALRPSGLFHHRAERAV
jgi:branched-chain amino acid transport system permease protein